MRSYSLVPKEKFTRFLRSKSVESTKVDIGNIIEIYVGTGKQKRGKWLFSRCILDLNRQVCPVTAAGNSGGTISETFESGRPCYRQIVLLK